MTAYDAVLFDMDGVLLSQSSEDEERENGWWARVEQTVDGALTAHGIKDTHPAYRPLFNRMHTIFTGQASGIDERLALIDEIAAVCQGDSELYRGDPVVDHRDLWETHEYLSARVQKKQVDRRERVFYDDVTTIEDLYDMVSIGKMSNNNHTFVEYVAGHQWLAADAGLDAPLDAYIDTCYGIGETVEEQKRKKPSPAKLEKAADDINADNPLYVGDSRCDIEAAENAGMDAVFLRRPHRADYELNGHNPVDELSSLTELPDIVRYGPDAVE